MDSRRGSRALKEKVPFFDSGRSRCCKKRSFDGRGAGLLEMKQKGVPTPILPVCVHFIFKLEFAEGAEFSEKSNEAGERAQGRIPQKSSWRVELAKKGEFSERARELGSNFSSAKCKR